MRASLRIRRWNVDATRFPQPSRKNTPTTFSSSVLHPLRRGTKWATTVLLLPRNIAGQSKLKQIGSVGSIFRPEKCKAATITGDGYILSSSTNGLTNPLQHVSEWTARDMIKLRRMLAWAADRRSFVHPNIQW